MVVGGRQGEVEQGRGEWREASLAVGVAQGMGSSQDPTVNNFFSFWLHLQPYLLQSYELHI